MILADIANYVCTATGYVQSDDLAAAKSFTLARDRLIYDAALWKSSLVQCDIALDPVNNENHAAGLVLLPDVISRPVAVRTTDNAVRVNGLEYYFRVDADKFAESGAPFEFSELPPAWLIARAGVPQWQDYAFLPPGQVTNYHTVAGSPYYADLATVAGATYQATMGAGDYGTDSNNHLAAGQTETFTAAGGTTRFYGAGNQIVGVKLKVLTSGSGGYVKITNASQTDEIVPIKVTWRDSAGQRYVVNQKCPIKLTPPPGDGLVTIESIFKPVTDGLFNVLVENPISGTDSFLETTAGSVDKGGTRTPRSAQLRLFGKPSVAVALKVLGKAVYQGLDFDQQEQTVRNAEDCLIAFVRADMLRRGGENGEAANAVQEAAELLQQLKDIEAVQSANNVRIIPDSGYGPEWGLGPYIRPYF